MKKHNDEKILSESLEFSFHSVKIKKIELLDDID